MRLVRAVVVFIALAGCSRGPESHSAPAVPSPAVVAPPAPRVLPEELHAEHEEIQKLQARRDFSGAAARYPVLLVALERAWGTGSSDMAPYVYNYALALRLAGREGECIAIAARGLAKWPDDLQLQTLEATARARIAIERGAFDARADELSMAVLRPANLPRLRGLRLDPAELHSQRAEMLFRARRDGDAEAAARAALELDPRQRHARDVLGRVLLTEQRPAEALPILAGLLAERPDPTLELSAAMALLDLGKPAEALEKLSRLLASGEAPVSDGKKTGEALFRQELRLRSARALNDLGRHREAAEVLLGVTLEDADDGGALQEIARAARGLGAGAAAAALDHRVRALQTRQHDLDMSSQARRSGFLSSVPYYRALAELEVERTGEALRLIDEAMAAGPTIARLHVERSRVRVLLGRLRLAEAGLREALNVAPAPLLLAAAARVAALRGNREEARALLADPRAAVRPADAAATAGDALSAHDAGLFAELRALAHLELGEADAAKAAAPESREQDGLAARLCRAEIALYSGDLDAARAQLAASFQDIPGGAGWAAALRDLIALREGVSAKGVSGNGVSSRASAAASGAASLEALDPSNLLDHPRLFLDAACGCPAAAAERLRAAHSRRGEILAAIDIRAGADAVPEWHRLLDSLLELGAARKAREVAWFLVVLRPEIAEQRALARALAAPEEVVPRLQAIEAALRLARDDADLERSRREARIFLGLEAAR